MPFVLRKKNDEANPKLPDAWGTQQTAGRLVYWYYSGGRTYFIVLFCRGGKYGCDGLNFFRYNGTEVPEFEPGHEDDEAYRNWRFHPGTVTKQIVVKNFTADNSTETFTSNAHGYNDDETVRIKSLGGILPTGLVANQLYYIVNKTTNTFQLSLTEGGSAEAITTDGTGTLKIWRANAGFDDPDQGRPQFFPELDLTFSNICYIEGVLPTALSEDAEPNGFQFGIRCRKVADYDDEGNFIEASFSANNARVYADILFNDLNKPLSRLHFESWHQFKVTCDKLIWDRVPTDAGSVGTGLSGRYYEGLEFETLYRTKIDSTINFLWLTSTIEGNTNDNHSMRWEGRVKPEFTEVYTFKVNHNDGARLWVDNNLIIDEWGSANVGIDTGSISLTADAVVNIKLELQNYLGGYIDLYWSSASQTEEIIPENRLYPLDTQSKYAEAHVVFDGATLGGAALQEVMKRAPGWHDQDVNGQMSFLPPDREAVHILLYDPAETGERWNIVSKTFEARPRPSTERINFRVHYYNDLNEDLLAEKWIEADRPNLRERQGGIPTDASPARWGMMTRSLTSRCAELEMKLFSDADREFILRGQADSYHVSKGDRVQIAHIAAGDTLENIVDCLVTAEGFAAGPGDEKSYTLLPAVFPLTTVEEVEEE